jgi:hypothetical protein
MTTIIKNRNFFSCLLLLNINWLKAKLCSRVYVNYSIAYNCSFLLINKAAIEHKSNLHLEVTFGTKTRACNRSPGSKLLSITMQLHCGSHLGGRAQLPDTILEEDHPMTIPSKFGFN